MRMKPEAILDEIIRRAPLRDRDTAEAVVDATLELLGQCLPRADAKLIAPNLPDRFSAALLRGPARDRPPRPHELFARVAARRHVSVGLAIEQVQAVCRTLGGTLSAEVRAHLEGALSPEWVALFREPVRSAANDLLRGTPAGHGHTLATGRPGSAHPLADARLPLAQAHSIALSDNPHADGKVSSGDLEAAQTLATGRPGGDAPLADAKDERRR